MHLASSPASTPPLDAELVRVKNGDRDAISRLYAAEVDALYAFVHPRVGARKDVAEDVVQTVFMQAFHQIERFDPRRAPSATGTSCRAATPGTSTHGQIHIPGRYPTELIGALLR